MSVVTVVEHIGVPVAFFMWLIHFYHQYETSTFSGVGSSSVSQLCS